MKLIHNRSVILWNISQRSSLICKQDEGVYITMVTRQVAVDTQ